MSTSREHGLGSLADLREHAVKAAAKVGLLWSLALLWLVFTTTAARGSEDAALTAAGDTATLAFVNVGEAPRTSGLALALTVLVGGLTLLVWGSLRGATPTSAPTPTPVDEPDGPDTGLELGLGLGLAPQGASA